MNCRLLLIPSLIFATAASQRINGARLLAFAINDIVHNAKNNPKIQELIKSTDTSSEFFQGLGNLSQDPSQAFNIKSVINLATSLEKQLRPADEVTDDDDEDVYSFQRDFAPYRALSAMDPAEFISSFKDFQGIDQNCLYADQLVSSMAHQELKLLVNVMYQVCLYMVLCEAKEDLQNTLLQCQSNNLLTDIQMANMGEFFANGHSAYDNPSPFINTENAPHQVVVSHSYLDPVAHYGEDSQAKKALRASYVEDDLDVV